MADWRQVAKAVFACSGLSMLGHAVCVVMRNVAAALRESWRFAVAVAVVDRASIDGVLENAPVFSARFAHLARNGISQAGEVTVGFAPTWGFSQSLSAFGDNEKACPLDASWGLGSDPAPSLSPTRMLFLRA